VKTTIKIYNTCPNNTDTVWLGCYLNEETGESSNNPNNGVLVTVDKKVREEFELNNIPLLNSTVRCTLQEDFYTKGKKLGKKYYRIVEAELPRINNELVAPRKYAQVSVRDTKVELHFTIIIGDKEFNLRVSNYDEVQEACKQLEEHAMIYENRIDLLNTIIDIENKLLDKIEYVRDKQEDQDINSATRYYSDEYSSANYI